MKSNNLTRTLLAAAAFCFSAFSCFGQQDPAGMLAGTWVKVIEMQTIQLSFTSDNKTEVEFTGDDVVDVYSSYEISRNRITFNDEAGDFAADVPGVYEFKVTDTSLSFTTVNDPVEGRSMLLEGTWSKRGEQE